MKRPSAPPSAAVTLWNTAVQHHQAGRLMEAQALYRQVLAAAPMHADAKHLLGVVALQTGRLDEAATLIGEALQIDPKHAIAHNNLGNVQLRQGRDDEALASFRQAVQIKPSYGDAQFNIGVLLQRTGRHREAIGHLQRAVAANAKWFEANLNLGAAQLQAGEPRAAANALQVAGRLKPDSVEAASLLGLALAGAGEPHRALEALVRARKIDPQSAEACARHGVVLADLGRLDEAREAFEQTLRLDPKLADAHTNLATLLCELGRPDDALTHFDRAIALRPGHVEAAAGKAGALRALGRTKEAAEAVSAMQRMHPRSAIALLEQAAESMRRHDPVAAAEALAAAVSADPMSAEAHYQRGHLAMREGLNDDALASYQRAVQVDPTHVKARWALTMAQVAPLAGAGPTVQKSRAAFARMLTELDRWFDTERSRVGHKAVGTTQPFYLAYHAEDNRELLQRYGALCSRLMAPWQAQFVPAGPSSSRDTRLPIRVGIASAHLVNHSVWNALIKGWVKHMDPLRFQLHLYHLGERSDEQTELAGRLAHRLVRGPMELQQWARCIRDDSLDVLVYPEIGMDATTTRLASMRLAPVQAASWGHPETTGLPTIDYYIGAESLEPPEAETRYTEQLCLLPGLGVCYEPFEATAASPDLAELGLPNNRPLALCPGMPFKYAPEHDRVWIEISRRAPTSRLVFFRPRDGQALADALKVRLERQYAQAGLDFHDCVSFVPFLDQTRFFGLMRRSHLFLDTIGFSGFNTAMQATECDLPIVTVEAGAMRGRFAAAILRHIGLDELVASSEEAYIQTAVAVLHDASRRAALSRHIAENRAKLFGHKEPVRGLERFFEQVRA
jgi:protein O-GlcNAc transferase